MPLAGDALLVLANRTDAYSLVGKARPAPYYRIDIFKSADFGRRIDWAPSRHVFRVIDGVNAPANNFPPSAPYWRSVGKTLESELQRAVRDLTARPASATWR